MGLFILISAAILALVAGVLGAFLGLTTGILLRMIQGRPRVTYSGGWAASLVLLAGGGAVLGAIGSIALFLLGLGGNAGSGITLYGCDLGKIVSLLLKLVVWLPIVGVVVLIGGIIVWGRSLPSGRGRAGSVELDTEPRDDESS